MNILNKKLLATAVVACLAIPAMSFAGEFCQYGKDGMMGDGMMGGRMMDREAEHKKLHELLKLTAEQEGPWKAYADSMMPGKPMMGDKTDMDKLTTPERADKMLEFSKIHQQSMETHVAAMKTFYVALTPAQQKIYDDFHNSHKPMMKNRMPMNNMPAKDMPMQDKPVAK
jgi:periplasmic protein CpxP/Spy